APTALADGAERVAGARPGATRPGSLRPGTGTRWPGLRFQGRPRPARWLACCRTEAYRRGAGCQHAVPILVADNSAALRDRRPAVLAPAAGPGHPPPPYSCHRAPGAACLGEINPGTCDPARRA